jgi:hypothetical protein
MDRLSQASLGLITDCFFLLCFFINRAHCLQWCLPSLPVYSPASSPELNGCKVRCAAASCKGGLCHGPVPFHQPQGNR